MNENSIEDKHRVRELPCPYCGKLAEICNGKQVYKKPSLEHKMFYMCRKCKAIIGCYNGTSIPYGTLANRKLRAIRKMTRTAMDSVWQHGLVPKSEVNGWIEEQLQQSFDLRTSFMDEETGMKVQELCVNFVRDSYLNKLAESGEKLYLVTFIFHVTEFFWENKISPKLLNFIQTGHYRKSDVVGKIKSKKIYSEFASDLLGSRFCVAVVESDWKDFAKKVKYHGRTTNDMAVDFLWDKTEYYPNCMESFCKVVKKAKLKNKQLQNLIVELSELELLEGIKFEKFKTVEALKKAGSKVPGKVPENLNNILLYFG